MKHKNKYIFILFVFLFICPFLNFGQTPLIDSLKNELNNCETDSCQKYFTVEVLYFLSLYNMDSFKVYADKVLEENIIKNDERGITIATVNIVRYYRYKSDYMAAINSIMYAYKLLTHKKLKLALLLDLAELNRTIENFDDALLNLDEAVNFAKETNDSKRLARAYNRKAAIYLELYEFEKTLLYADSSLNVEQSEEYPPLIANNNEIIGAVHKNYHEFDLALTYYSKAMEINIKTGDSVALQNNYSNIGLVYYEKKEYKDAIKYLEKSVDLCHKFSLDVNLISQLNFLAYSYAGLGEYKNAYLLIDSTRELYNDLFNIERDKQIQNLNKKYELEKKELLLQQKQKQIEHNILIIKQQKTQKFGVLTILFMVFVFTVFAIITSFRIRRRNKKLNEQKQEIETQNEEILLAYEHMEEMSKFKENMTQMIAHDLKNPLSVITNTSKNIFVKEAGIQMLNLVNNMLDVQKYEVKEMQLELSENSLLKLSKEAEKQVISLLEQKNLKVINKINTNLFVKVDKDVTIRIFVNLLTNAIKFSPENGKIIIDFDLIPESENLILLKIIDFGAGIPKDKISKVFDKFEQVITKKSGSVASTGLGLSFCKIAIESHGGEIAVSSDYGKQTAFSFSLPFLKNISETTKINPQIKHTHTFLNETERKYLKKYLSEYLQYEIWEIIALRNITNKIDDNFSENIKSWKEKMQKIIYNCNEKEYNRILSQLNNTQQ